jgi:uncharacterized protein YaiI (UPF0178 family)
MKILIDADGSPVRELTIQIAKTYQLEVIVVCNYHHQITSEYAKVVTVDSGRDMADYEIVQRIEKGDLVVTQDYGLASLVIMKNGFALHQNGWFYTKHNIDMLLLQRQISQKVRKSKKRVSHIPKRKESDNVEFEKTLVDFIRKYKK